MRARWSKSGFLAVPLALALLLSWSSSASAAAPSIEAEYVTDVSYSRVVFQGQVNPNASPTSYRFEYGPTTTYGSSVPVPDASVGSSSELIAFRQEAGQLQPGVTYHYRLVATSAEGAVEGPDKTFTTYETEPPEKADSCPNAAYRTGASANLPDCRAYEMVSPVDKNGADVDSQEYKEFTSSVSGDRVEFPVRTGFGETKGSGLGGYTQFMASRGADGWTTKGIIPTPALNDTLQLFYGSTYVLDLSEDFSRAALTGYDLP